MEISKSAVLLANEHQSNQKKMLKMIFVFIFAMYSFTQKNDSVNGMSENVALRRILTKMAASVFHRIYSNIKNLCMYKSPIHGDLPHEEAD